MWIKVEDDKVRHHWKSVDGVQIATVTPDWYEENGTPIDWEGEDMKYSYTEIWIEKEV